MPRGIHPVAIAAAALLAACDGLTVIPPPIPIAVGATGGALYRTGPSPGTATITSPHDQSLAFAVDVVDRATVTVDWKPDLAGISANGISALVRPTAKTSTRSLCVIPGGAYTATVQSPGVCEVAHVPAPGQTELTWSTSATLPDAGNPELRVRGRASGSCNIEVRDQTGTFIKQLQLTVQP